MRHMTNKKLLASWSFFQSGECVQKHTTEIQLSWLRQDFIWLKLYDFLNLSSLSGDLFSYGTKDYNFYSYFRNIHTSVFIFYGQLIIYYSFPINYFFYIRELSLKRTCSNKKQSICLCINDSSPSIYILSLISLWIFKFYFSSLLTPDVAKPGFNVH